MLRFKLRSLRKKLMRRRRQFSDKLLNAHAARGQCLTWVWIRPRQEDGKSQISQSKRRLAKKIMVGRCLKRITFNKFKQSLLMTKVGQCHKRPSTIQRRRRDQTSGQLSTRKEVVKSSKAVATNNLKEKARPVSSLTTKESMMRSLRSRDLKMLNPRRRGSTVTTPVTGRWSATSRRQARSQSTKSATSPSASQSQHTKTWHTSPRA